MVYHCDFCGAAFEADDEQLAQDRLDIAAEWHVDPSEMGLLCLTCGERLERMMAAEKPAEGA